MPSQWSINMIKVVWFRFQQFLVPLLCCLSKVLLKHELLEIYFVTHFGVRNFENTSAMRVTFSLKMSNFNLTFKNAERNWENVFCFFNNCIWNGSLKLSLLRREYLWWEVNVLRNGLKNLHISKRDFFQLTCLHSDQ